jgi:hypothetical protein
MPLQTEAEGKSYPREKYSAKSSEKQSSQFLEGTTQQKKAKEGGQLSAKKEGRRDAV